MTLSPVFRSAQAVDLLEQQGIWERFGPALAMQLEAVQAVHDDLEHVIDAEYRLDPGQAMAPENQGDNQELAFLQDYFSIIFAFYKKYC